MKNKFSSLTHSILKFCFIIFGVLIIFAACEKKQKITPEFTLHTPGGKVAELWGDSLQTLPKVIYYYKVDTQGNTTDEQIGVAEYYQNQQEYVTGGLKEGKREGKWYAFFPDGSVQTDAFFVNGKEHGAYNLYRENGKPLQKGQRFL
jgi:antitoxin component YwqK of YwqJK toxin-antitoxin module